MNRPTFSIIVGLYNHKHYLPKLIEALEKQNWKDFEVIFCDDGSTDGTKEYFTIKDDHGHLPRFSFKYKYVWQKNKGMRLAKNLNNGFKIAEGKYFVLIMGDSYPETDYLYTLAIYRNRDFILNGVRVQIDGYRAVDVDWRLKAKLIPEEDRLLLEPSFNSLTGNGLCIPRKVYEDIGGWNEKLEGYGGDDTEFVFRAYYKGYLLMSLASAILYHNWHKNTETNPKNLKIITNLILQYAKQK